MKHTEENFFDAELVSALYGYDYELEKWKGRYSFRIYLFGETKPTLSFENYEEAEVLKKHALRRLKNRHKQK